MGNAQPMTVIAVAPSLERRVKERATAIGFDPVGIARLGPAKTYEAFAEWLRRGYTGEMTYLPRGAEKRRDTTLPFQGAPAPSSSRSITEESSPAAQSHDMRAVTTITM